MFYVHPQTLGKMIPILTGAYFSDGLVEITHSFPASFQKKSPRPVLQSGLVHSSGGDSHMQGLAEFVFAASCRARDPNLSLGDGW